MQKILGVLAVLLLAGCASDARKVTAPDGKPAVMVTCSGTRSETADCLDEAAKQCPTGYDVLSASQGSPRFVMVGNLAGTIIDREMLIRCK